MPVLLKRLLQQLNGSIRTHGHRARGRCWAGRQEVRERFAWLHSGRSEEHQEAAPGLNGLSE